MTRLAVLGVILSGVLLGPGAGAVVRQSPQTPAPARADAATGTALIGRVVDIASGDPVPGAIVTLSGRPVPPRGRGAAPPPAGNLFDLIATMAGPAGGGLDRVAADADGRFVFPGLPVSTYSVRANAPGYVAEYSGALGVTGGPATVEIRQGQVTVRVRVALWKEAVLTGVVVDEASEPLIRARVSAYRRTISRFGVVTYDAPRSATTDDRGEYRIFGLAPGDYFVVVPQSHTTSLAAGADAMMRGLLTGQLDMKEMASLGRGGSPMDPRAIRVGEWRLSPDNVAVPGAGPDAAMRVYRTVYYPAALTAASAQFVTLRAAEQRSGVDFALQPVVAGRVTGMVSGPAGPVPAVTVRLVAAGDRVLGEARLPTVARTQTDASGRFTLLAVPPGQYRVIAVREAADLPDDLPEEVAANPLMKMALAMRGTSGPLYGEAAAGIGGSEAVEVSITASEGVDVRGQLAFEGGPKPDPTAIARTRILLRPLDAGSSARTARADAGSRFNVRGVLPDRYGVSAILTDGTTPWLIREVIANGRDVTNAPILVEDKAIEMTVRLTNQVGTLRGTVRRSLPSVATDATVLPALTAIMVPANYAEWTDLQVAIERVRFAPVGQDDTFRVGPVLPGEYLVAVVNEGQLDLSRGLAALSVVASEARRVNVAAGGPTNVTVGVAGGRQ